MKQKETPNPSRLRGRGVEVSKTLFYIKRRKRRSAMSAEDMMRFLDQCNIETELKFRVAFHCGPVLKNVKASNAMNARPGTWNRIWRSLKGTAVSCIPLYRG